MTTSAAPSTDSLSSQGCHVSFRCDIGEVVNRATLLNEEHRRFTGESSAPGRIDAKTPEEDVTTGRAREKAKVGFAKIESTHPRDRV